VLDMMSNVAVCVTLSMLLTVIVGRVLNMVVYMLFDMHGVIYGVGRGVWV